MVSRRLTLEEKKRMIRDFINENPVCTYLDIKTATKLKVERIYANMAEAYADANVPLPAHLKKRSRVQQRREVISYIRKNPLCTVTDIINDVGVNIIRIFGSIQKAYFCAGIRYPIRDFSSGVVNPDIFRRAFFFELEVVEILKAYGVVKRRVKNAAGIADAVLQIGDVEIVVEIKDYRGQNNITMFELKQLARYMRALGVKNGLLVCPESSFPRRKNGRNVYIDDLNLVIATKGELRGRSINLLGLIP